MLTPTDPRGVRAINSHPFLGKASVAENAESVTITLPVALPFYYCDLMANWNCGHPYVISQTQTTCVMGFPTLAPAGAEILWKITA